MAPNWNIVDFIKSYWWKTLGFLLVFYSLFAGLTVTLPKTEMLLHTMRNVFYHVPMWFVMILLFTVSFIYSLLYLNKLKAKYDYYAHAFAKVGALFGILGLITGMIWARATWGVFWNDDAKLTGAAICLLIYGALFILRNSVKDMDKRGRISAVYNVFAYFLMFPAIYIIPSYAASSHPGGNGPDDEPLMVFKMMPALRGIFYPAVIGWFLIGLWVAQLKTKIYLLQDKQEEQQQ